MTLRAKKSISLILAFCLVFAAIVFIKPADVFAASSSKDVIVLTPVNNITELQLVDVYIEKDGNKGTLVLVPKNKSSVQLIENALEEVEKKVDTWVKENFSTTTYIGWLLLKAKLPSFEEMCTKVEGKLQYRIPIDSLPASGTFTVPVLGTLSKEVQNALDEYIEMNFQINLDRKTIALSVKKAEGIGLPIQVTPTITIPKTDYTYTGKTIKPVPTVSLFGITLDPALYTVTYDSGCKNIGTYQVKAVLKGKFLKGSASAMYNIVAKKLPSTVSIPKASYTYTGNAIKPTVTVKDGSKVLQRGTDYTVKYASNTNVGTATVTVTGKGNYTGTRKVTFQITKAANTLTVKTSAKSYKQSSLTQKKTFSIGVANAKGKVTYALDSKAKAAKITVSSKGLVTVPKNCKKGTYRIKVTAAGNANYKSGSKTVTITVK